MKRAMRSLSYSVLTFGLLGFVAGCGTNSANENVSGSGPISSQGPINIAIIVPLSGSDASVGQQSVNAAKLAVDDINNSNGIKALGGRKLHLIITDSTEQPQDAATAAERLFQGGGITAAYGMDLSPLTEAALPVISRYHIPMVTASIADSLTSSGNQYIFEIAPKGSQFGQTEVKFVEYLNSKYHMNLKKAAIVYVNNSYGSSTAQGVKSLIEQAGMQVVLNTAYPANITDATPLVSKIVQSGAQVLFPVSYISDAELIISAMDAQHSHILTIGGGAGFIWPPIEQAIGSKVNGLTSVASWNWDSENIVNQPSLLQVTQDYKSKYGTYMPEQAGEAFAGIYAIADAINVAKSTDPQKVRDALAQLNVSSGGASLMQPGHVAFDANGFNSPVTPVMIQWQNDVPKSVYPPEDASVKLIKP